MPKKKSKKKQQQVFLSPENYLKQKARSLKIGKCYISDGFDDVGEGHIIVTRLHTGGNVSAGVFLVDKYCLGVKDSFYRLRMPDYEFEEMLDAYNGGLGLDEISYEEAHNRIYGAVAYAEEAGIAPDKSFSLTQYLLEEDTDDIPLIEYEYGKDGMHHLVVHSNLEASRYLPLLEKNLGDNFTYAITDIGDGEYDGPDDGEVEDYYPETEYTYKHPEYPSELALDNPRVKELLCIDDWLSDIDIDELLEFPRESLRRDVENVLLYAVGKNCDKTFDEMNGGVFIGDVTNALVMLGEVGDAESSLDVVLETLRQSEDFYEYHIGDCGPEVYVPTLYLIGRDKLDRIVGFLKEEGLCSYCKSCVLPLMSFVVKQQPERRDEVIWLMRDVLRFAAEKLSEVQFIDGYLAGCIANECIDLCAGELLPELKAMFDTGLVDESLAGDYEEVEKCILSPEYWKDSAFPLDVYERFEKLRLTFK